MLKSRNNKARCNWKFIVINDNDGKEIQRLELNENQKLMAAKVRNKKRKLNHQLDSITEIPLEMKIQFDFHEEVIFSREAINEIKPIPDSYYKNSDFVSVIEKVEPDLDLLNSDAIFGPSYASGIDPILSDKESSYLTSLDNLDNLDNLENLDVFCI